MKRRFTLRGREKDKDKEKEKKPRKLKRRESDNSALGGSLELLPEKHKRRRATTFSPIRSRTNDSSGESSMSSGLNWSIPNDLPGAVAAPLDHRHHGRRGIARGGRVSDSNNEGMLASLRAKWRSTPTIYERKESSDSNISVSDVRILGDGPLTADVAIQVNSGGRIFKFPSPTSPASPEDSDALSRSLPGTPGKTRQYRMAGGVLRKLTTSQEVRDRYTRRSSSPIHSQLLHKTARFSTPGDGGGRELDERPSSSQGFASAIEEEMMEVSQAGQHLAKTVSIRTVGLLLAVTRGITSCCGKC